MRKRLIASIAVGLLGLAVSVPLSDSMEWPRTIALVGCSLAGLVIGFVASTLFEVFAGNPHDGDVTSG